MGVGPRPTKTCSGAGCAMRSMTLGRLPGCMFATALVGACLAAAARPGAAGEVPDSGGWSTGAPRDEIRPEFACEPGDGPGRRCGARHQGRAARRRGRLLDEDLPRHRGPAITGSTRATRRRAWTVPRRSVVAEIHWRDAEGRHVPLDEPAVSGYLRGATPMAETEFPATRGDDGRAGPRSPTPTGPRRGRPGRSSSCTCAGPGAARCAGATCR